MKKYTFQYSIFFVIISALFLSCNSSNSSTGDEPAVNWVNYDKTVKERIDLMTNKLDCTGLQNEFNLAEQNSDNQRARVGEGNLNLMNYIDFKMKKCNCYK